MELEESITTKLEAIEKSLEGTKLLTKKEFVINKLATILSSAVKKKVSSGRVGVGFSGGVDSSIIALLCSKLKANFKLYAVGMQGSSDLESARELAIKMSWPIKFKIITLGEAEAIIKKVTKLLPNADVVNVGVGCVTYSVLQMAKEDNVKTVFSGLGSEELFAGYERHKQKIGDGLVHEECWKGLKSIWQKDLVRDLIISKHFNTKIVCPFLDEDLVSFAMKISPKLKISQDMKKIILREAAVKLGLPKKFSYRKKIAAQYGSNFDKAMQKIAKKAGKRKLEFIKSLRKEISVQL